MTHLDLSHPGLDLVYSTLPRLSLERWGNPGGMTWAHSASALFSFDALARRFDARGPAVTVAGTKLDARDDGRYQAIITLVYQGWDLEADLHILSYPDTALIEQWLTIRNRGSGTTRLERVDSFSFHLPPGAYQLESFHSAWGREFSPESAPLAGSVCLENRSGRSSNGMFPSLTLLSGDEFLTVSLAWSGNWVIRIEPEGDGYVLSGGLHDWKFFTDLAPGGEFETPRAVLATARGGLDEISRQYHLAGRRYWYPRNEISQELPVEWNHWWAYEDTHINEATFRANVDVAAGLGLSLCTLDAGWFGASSTGTRWEEQRGDWDTVNAARFPSGLRALADYTHGRGLMFGLWCEIEALGAQAKLAEQHPELVATRDGTPLGYVCLGCPDAREWAFRTLERLVHEYDCDWIKLDFNLDPGAGCDRTDHGHGAGDGLYAHYRGYYAVLDRVREQYPRVVLENCSSGGLRVDPEIVRHTHLSFLSDPDWPEHNLQVFWGATTILAPEVCLHWSWSQTLPTQGRAGFDPRDPALTSEHLDYVIRTALLGAAGFSLRLPDVPPWVRERIRDHVRCYDRDMSRFILEAELHRLTDQPDRESAGDRWCAFQYSLPAEHMLVVFRLPGAEPRPPLHMRGLNPEERYRLTSVPNGESEERRGRDLMEEGLALDLPERGSTVILIQQENMPA